ncbi:MAG: cyanophycin synthetase [Gemmataceae bacterium]
MHFGRIWTMRGPNRWAPVPVLEAELDLGDEANLSPSESRFSSRFAEWAESGSTSKPTHFADALLALIQSMQRRLECGVRFGNVYSTAKPGYYRVVFEYDEEHLAKAMLQAGFDALQSIIAGVDFDFAKRLTELRDLAHQMRLGPSTRAIVEAAKRRGIPTRRLNEGSLVLLGWGVRQKRIWTAETDDTPALAEIVAQDKQLTRNLLYTVGCPVPWGRPVVSADDAWVAAEEVGLPVVVKPQYGNQGRGVATDLHTREQVVAAYEAAKQESEFIVVETHLQGSDYRLLVVGDTLAAASLREPAHVVGDGRSTIQELIAETNKDPRRSDGHATPLSFLKIDAVATQVLAEQGMRPESVPGPGMNVLIRRNANLSTGGTATDVTDLVHPEAAMNAIEAARAVGLDIAGVDVVATDISQPLHGQRAGIVEVNAGPGLRMHLEPSGGKPRDVGASIVDALFPRGDDGRIPTIAVTGTNGKTTTTRLITHLFRKAGKYVGMTCTDGIWLDGRRTETRDCSGPHSARSVLLNPKVEVAVLETARGGILREGLAFDEATVTVVTNLGQGDHLGLRGVDTLEELAHVKQVVPAATAPSGVAVLNAADPHVAAMAKAVRGRVLFFALDENHPVLAEHRRQEGLTAFERSGVLYLAEGSRELRLLAGTELPFAPRGKVPFQSRTPSPVPRPRGRRGSRSTRFAKD